jgi:class 3 adenylate cyclase
VLRYPGVGPLAVLSEAERLDGLLTFLFTDTEGSTRLWEQQPRAMRVVLFDQSTSRWPAP